MFSEIERIAIGSDHGGFELKEHLKEVLQKKGLHIIDKGTDNTDSVDYPDYGFAVAKAVVSGEAEGGIVICGTGIGISIAANRVPGARASLCHNTEYARLTRAHNNSNILALGGRFLSMVDAEAILETWLTTTYEGGRHETRVAMLDEIK